MSDNVEASEELETKEIPEELEARDSPDLTEVVAELRQEIRTLHEKIAPAERPPIPWLSYDCSPGMTGPRLHGQHDLARRKQAGLSRGLTYDNSPGMEHASIPPELPAVEPIEEQVDETGKRLINYNNSAEFQAEKRYRNLENRGAKNG